MTNIEEAERQIFLEMNAPNPECNLCPRRSHCKTRFFEGDVCEED